jgi:hypothetical protein
MAVRIWLESGSGIFLNDGTNADPVNWVHAPYAPSDYGLSDYVVEAEMQLINRPCGNFGIVVRDDYWVGFFTCTGGSYAAMKITYRAAQFGILERGFPLKQEWQTFRVETKGNTIKLLVNGAIVLEAQDNRNISGGKIGLWSDDAQVNVRSFRVTAQ